MNLADWKNASSPHFFVLAPGKSAGRGLCNLLLIVIPRPAPRALYNMHLPAERNGRNDKEERKKPHAGLADKLGYISTRSTAKGFGHKLRSPEKDLRSND